MPIAEIMKLDTRQRLNMGRLLKNPEVTCVQVTDLGNGRLIVDAVSEVKTQYEESLRRDPYIRELIEKDMEGGITGRNPLPDDIVALSQ